jgi:hypothetical protein
MRVFEGIFDRFCLILGPKFVKIRGLKSFYWDELGKKNLINPVKSFNPVKKSLSCFPRFFRDENL